MQAYKQIVVFSDKYNTMRKRYFLAVLLSFSIAVIFAQSNQQPATTAQLRHVVMFKFKDNTSAATIKKVEEAFRALPAKISLIKGFEWGVNNSPEKLNQGLTHCFFLSFSSEKDRDAYLVHPDHKAFTEIAGPLIDKVTVVDYWAHR
jgi:hypothetical protein